MVCHPFQCLTGSPRGAVDPGEGRANGALCNQCDCGRESMGDPAEDLQKAGRSECFPGQAAETLRRVGSAILSVGTAVSCVTPDSNTPFLSTFASRRAAQIHERAAQREQRGASVLFGPPPAKGRGAQPVAKRDQARITLFFTRTPVPGKPLGTRLQQEEPPEAAEAAELGTEVTRDAGSAPPPAAECGEAPWATPGLRSLVLRLRLRRRRWCRVTTARHINL
eukprot:365467-Chlamydomonas_euryale.AAC.31